MSIHERLKNITHEVAGHVVTVEFHVYFFHLIDALPDYDLPRLPDRVKGELLAKEDCELLSFKIVKHDGTVREYDNVPFPKRYSNVMFFYIYDDISPVFFPSYEFHTISPNGAILRDLFVRFNRGYEVNVLLPQLMLNFEMGDMKSIYVYCEERGFSLTMEFFPPEQILPDPRRDTRLLEIEPIVRPELVDLRPIAPPIFNQGDLGTCGVAAVTTFLEYITESRLSVLYLYYTTRKIRNYSPFDDSGVELEDCLDALSQHGICRDQSWPYISSKFLNEPPTAAFEEAEKFKPTKKDFRKLNNIDEMKESLRNKLPFFLDVNFTEETYGRKVYSTGIIPPAPTNDFDVCCVHSCVVVGYDDKKEGFIIQNSWGRDWGMEGYGTLPYDYIKKNLFKSAFTWASPRPTCFSSSN